MYTHTKFDHVFVGSPDTRTSFVICATPRSGSSLLCELLTNTGLAGAPTEFFDQTHMDMFMNSWGVSDLDGYVRKLLEKKTGPNGLFGFKVHFSQLMASRCIESLSTFPDLRYIYTERRDHLEQAISFTKATQTGQWASTHPSRRDAAFDRAQIEEMLRWIDREERGWKELFAKRSIVPLTVVYEDFVASQEATLRSVLRFLDIEAPAGFELPQATLQKQADGMTTEWRRRYENR